MPYMALVWSTSWTDVSLGFDLGDDYMAVAGQLFPLGVGRRAPSLFGPQGRFQEKQGEAFF